MLQTQTVSTELLELLKELMIIEEFGALRLVGGTSLALQLGHRNSIDIDLFGNLDLDDYKIVEILKQFKQVEIIASSKSIKIFMINNIKVDLVNYPYMWIDNQLERDGIRLAGLKDIAAMKISAITQRGSKKDFIDLYFLLKSFSFNQIMEFYMLKITDGNEWLALRSLTYFDDADEQPMPKMYKDAKWEDIKSLIAKEIIQYQN